MKNMDILTDIFVELKTFDYSDYHEAVIVCDELGMDRKEVTEWGKTNRPYADLINKLEFEKFFMGNGSFSDRLYNSDVAYTNHRVNVIDRFNRRMALEQPQKAEEIMTRGFEKYINVERTLSIY